MNTTQIAPSISVVVPVYNSVATLEPLCKRVHEALNSCTAQYEIVFVNDGSSAQSWPEIVRLAAAYPFVRGIDLMRNFGQHNALLCGIRHAKYGLIATIDDDLQNPPEEIPTLLEELRKGFDLVYGVPQREQHGMLRDAASRITKLTLQHSMGSDVAGHASAFRLFRTDLRKGFEQYSGPYVSVDVLLTWGGKHFSMVKVRHDPRQEGASNYTFRKLLTHAINMMTGFSTLPLQIASIVGFAFTLFGMGVLFYVLMNFLLRGAAVQGFAFLASIIAIFSGAMLFSLGIIGEYLARIHFRIMGKPPYVRNADVGFDTTEKNSAL